MELGELKTRIAQFNQTQRLNFTPSTVFTLLWQRSDFYDELLRTLWHAFELDKQSDLALIAVGGYGRREMFPLSDLDFLILSEKKIAQATQEKITTLCNLLWDSNLQLGCAVRTLEECVEIGRNEISVATNMLEGRFLCGNQATWQQLREAIFSPNFWAVPDFFSAKMAEKQERYQRYHNTGYNLEPDLKHSPGGLRDLHLMQWIMLRHAGIHTIQGLLEKGILVQSEFNELQHAQAVLFSMRFALHLQLKRYDNRLRFDRQVQLSHQLGYVTQFGEGNQAVEAMMKAFFQATQAISQISGLILSQFEQETLHPLQKIGEKQPLDTLFYLQNGTIFCRNPRQLQQQRESILDLFYHLTQLPAANVSAQTLRHLRLALKNGTEPLNRYSQARQRFIEIFRQPNAIQTAIVPMHRLGVLTAYLPQWQQIEGLMQFDLFHIYTVDEHSVRVMQKLESFLDPSNAEQHPLCCQLFSQEPKRHLIYLAALFHDIAKGREGDHAKVGAVDMREFAELHNFNEAETSFMCKLVEEHLTMSITAQRRDIHDQAIVTQFADVVETRDMLSALLCLTVADICATNETLWNGWKRTLFSKLYHFTAEQLAQHESRPNTQKTAKQNQYAAQEQLKFLLSSSEHENVMQFWQHCPESYFMRNSTAQLVWHALEIAKLRDTEENVLYVLLSNQYVRGATEIFIHCQDQAQLFTRIAYTLSRKNISIHDAQIITGENGLIFDSFIVTEQNGQALNLNRIEEVRDALLHTLKEATPLPKIAKKPRKHQSFKRQTRLRFLANSQPNQTACELFTPDREGLLAQIGLIFNRLELNLLNAKITTIGEQVEDFFVLCNREQQALSEEEKTQLQMLIMKELD